MGADLSTATGAETSEDFIRAFIPSYNPADNLGQQSLLDLVGAQDALQLRIHGMLV